MLILVKFLFCLFILATFCWQAFMWKVFKRDYFESDGSMFTIRCTNSERMKVLTFMSISQPRSIYSALFLIDEGNGMEFRWFLTAVMEASIASLVTLEFLHLMPSQLRQLGTLSSFKAVRLDFFAIFVIFADSQLVFTRHERTSCMIFQGHHFSRQC